MACVFPIVVLAVPARGTVMQVVQSDGSVLLVQMIGDEYMHYYLNLATNEKMYRGQDGDLHVLTDEAFILRKEKSLARRQEANQARALRLQKHGTKSPNGPRKIGSIGGGMIGSKKGLVILVNFSDKGFASEHTQTALDNQFNQQGYSEGGHLGSVHDYFYDQSYGQFDLTFDVVGPVKVSQRLSYYGTNDVNGDDKYPATMVIEACKLADAAGINFKDYDWDGDGEVDQVYVIYAGYGEAYGAAASTIWPHEWTLSSAVRYGDGTGALTLDGVKIDTYACSCELSGTTGSTLNGIGTACHEFSHCLGYPDFYDTSYAGGFGMNSWDLMDAGSYNGPQGCGEVPCGYTSYERWCAGWLKPTELTGPANISGLKSLDEEPEAYIFYNDKNSNEYIMLENRQNNKWYKYVDTYTTPHGLLAFHVDYDASAWEGNTPNMVSSHQRMSIIPASGVYGTRVSSSGRVFYRCTETHLKEHLFSGSGTKTSLTGTSNTASGGKWFTACSTGSTTLNHTVTEIQNEQDGTISFKFDGGVVDDGSRYTVTFHAGAGNCETSSLTETSYRSGVLLPTATIEDDNWVFAGWSVDSVASTTSRPTLYQAGSTYSLRSDVTLYAVYSHTDAGEQKDLYQYTTTFVGGEKYLFVSRNSEGEAYVLDAASLTATAATQCQGSVVSVKDNDGVPSIEMYPVTAEWTSSGTINKMQLKSGNDFLRINGNGVALTASSSDVYWSDAYGLYGKSNSGKTLYYGQIDQSGTISFVKTARAANRLYLFKYVHTDGSITTYATSPERKESIGDVTKDGQWDVMDVTALVDIILGKATPEDSSYDFEAADVDGDGQYTVSDVTKLVDIILGKDL